MQIQFIGCGKMGEAFLQGLLKIGITQTDISILEAYIPRVKELRKTYTNVNMKINTNADIVILATKPQQLHEINFDDFADNITILSMLAGSNTKTLKQYSKKENIIRCMPSLPLSIGQGCGGYYTIGKPDQTHSGLIKKLFNKLGYFIKVKDEDMIDKITAISGSGPAYFLYFTELLQQQAEQLGFTKQEAKNLTEQTFIGSAKLLEKSNISAKQLKENVASKGGTTEAALQIFQKEGLGKIINKASNSAYQKAKDLNS